MRGSGTEEDAVFVEVYGGREFGDEGHAEEHESEDGLSDEDVHVAGLSGSRSHAGEAVAIHGGSPPEDAFDDLRSRLLAFAEAELLGEEVGDHALCGAGVEERVGVNRFVPEAEFDVPDHDEAPRRAGDASLARNRRSSLHHRMKAGSSLSSGMAHVM